MTAEGGVLLFTQSQLTNLRADCVVAGERSSCFGRTVVNGTMLPNAHRPLSAVALAR